MENKRRRGREGRREERRERGKEGERREGKKVLSLWTRKGF